MDLREQGFTYPSLRRIRVDQNVDPEYRTPPVEVGMHVVDGGARGSRGPTYFQVRPPPLDALDLHSLPLTRDDPPGTATAGVI